MGPFKPIRFLNLLPLSHMFGQSMAALIPPMIAGDVFFTSGYGPRDIVSLIHRRRISVLVCVPQMLELLRYEIEQRFPESKADRKSEKWYWSWWQYRRVHSAFGWKFWCLSCGRTASCHFRKDQDLDRRRTTDQHSEQAIDHRRRGYGSVEVVLRGIFFV